MGARNKGSKPVSQSAALSHAPLAGSHLVQPSLPLSCGQGESLHQLRAAGLNRDPAERLPIVFGRRISEVTATMEDMCPRAGGSLGRQTLSPEGSWALRLYQPTHLIFGGALQALASEEVGIS